MFHVSAGAASLPDRDFQIRGGGVGGLQLSWIDPDAADIGADSQRRIAFRTGSRFGAFRGSNLRLSGFQVGALRIGLLDGVFHGKRHQGSVRNLVRDFVLVGWRQANHASEIDFLLGVIILEREQTLLFGEELHLIFVRVHLGDDPLLQLLDALLIDRIRGFDLGLFRGQACFGRGHLQVGARRPQVR